MQKNCEKCSEGCDKTEIITLTCKHYFCWNCIHAHIAKDIKPKIKCPIQGCPRNISDARIRQILSDKEVEKYEAACTRALQRNHKCLLTECDGCLLYTDSNVQYECPKCGLYNCIQCKAAHRYQTCEDYRKDGSKSFCETELDRARQQFNSILEKSKEEARLKKERMDVYRNEEITNCKICERQMAKEKGIVLRCGDAFCEDCIRNHINGQSSMPVPCPICSKPMDDREIRGILTADQLTIFVSKCASKATVKSKRTFQCQTPDCPYIVEIPNRDIMSVTCIQCNKTFCLKCRQPHQQSMTCSAYVDSIKTTSAGQHLLALQGQIQRRELMRCPDCGSIIHKTGGCNWIRCHFCDQELCWMLQTYRWGLKGRGDTSGGCRCGVDGKRCHVECTASCIPHSGS